MKPMKQVAETPSESDKLVFGERICFRPDPALLSVLNALNIKWANVTHAMNAILIHGVQAIVPEGMRLVEHPFDKNALDGPPAIAKKVQKAMKPAKKAK